MPKNHNLSDDFLAQTAEQTGISQGLLRLLRDLEPNERSLFVNHLKGNDLPPYLANKILTMCEKPEYQ